MLKPWILMFLLANGEAVVLRSSLEGCAAYVQDIGAGYQPQIWWQGVQVPVVTTICAPIEAAAHAAQSTLREQGSLPHPPEGAARPPKQALKPKPATTFKGTQP